MTWSKVYDTLNILEEDRLMWHLILGEKERLMCTLAQASDLIEGENCVDFTCHTKAMQFAVELGEQGKVLTLYHVLKLHQMAFPFGGMLRNTDAMLFGVNGQPPKTQPISYHMVSQELNQWVEDVNDALRWQVEYTDIAGLHIRFEQIHPFPDGNGRIGRMLINYMCAYTGLGLVCLTSRNRAVYFSYIDNSDTLGMARLLKRSTL